MHGKPIALSPGPCHPKLCPLNVQGWQGTKHTRSLLTCHREIMKVTVGHSVQQKDACKRDDSLVQS